jgi:hypothetical protein
LMLIKKETVVWTENRYFANLLTVVKKCGLLSYLGCSDVLLGPLQIRLAKQLLWRKLMPFSIPVFH